MSPCHLTVFCHLRHPWGESNSKSRDGGSFDWTHARIICFETATWKHYSIEFFHPSFESWLHVCAYNLIHAKARKISQKMHVKGLLPNIALFLFIIPNITSKMVEKNEFIYAAAESEATSLLEAPEEQVDALQVEIVGESNETTTNNTPTEHDRMVGAGVASGVIGMLVGGPFLGLLLGFGAAYASTKTDGPVGDAARAVGDVALVAKAKAQEVDAKHNLVTKTKVAAKEAWERAKQVDRKHNVLAKSKEFVVFSWCVNRKCCLCFVDLYTNLLVF